MPPGRIMAKFSFKHSHLRYNPQPTVINNLVQYHGTTNNIPRTTDLCTQRAEEDSKIFLHQPAVNDFTIPSQSAPQQMLVEKCCAIIYKYCFYD